VLLRVEKAGGGTGQLQGFTSFLVPRSNSGGSRFNGKFASILPRKTTRAAPEERAPHFGNLCPRVKWRRKVTDNLPQLSAEVYKGTVLLLPCTYALLLCARSAVTSLLTFRN
jgi:hypothetical protein